jgi:hypothetical protein
MFRLLYKAIFRLKLKRCFKDITNLHKTTFELQPEDGSIKQPKRVNYMIYSYNKIMLEWTLVYVSCIATRCCQMFSPIRPLPQPDCSSLSSLKFFVKIICLLTLDKIISTDAHQLKHSAMHSLRLAPNSPLVTTQYEQQMPFSGAYGMYFPGQLASSIPTQDTRSQLILASHWHSGITRRQADSRINVMRLIWNIYWVSTEDNEFCPLQTTGCTKYKREEMSVYRNYIYRMSQEECTKVRESVPYINLCRYNPKHLYPKLNIYGDNDHRIVWSSCGSMHRTSYVTW